MDTVHSSIENDDLPPLREGEPLSFRIVIRTPVFMPVGTHATVKAVGPDDLEALGATLTAELQTLLTRSGDYHGPASGHYDEATFQALEAYGGRENLEERLSHDPANTRIDRHVIDFMREHSK